MTLLHWRDRGRRVAEAFDYGFPSLHRLGLPLATHVLHNVGPDVGPLAQTHPEETGHKVRLGLSPRRRKTLHHPTVVVVVVEEGSPESSHFWEEGPVLLGAEGAKERVGFSLSEREAIPMPQRPSLCLAGEGWPEATSGGGCPSLPAGNGLS